MPPSDIYVPLRLLPTYMLQIQVSSFALQVGDMLVSVGDASSGSGAGSLQQVAAIVQVGSIWPADCCEPVPTVHGLMCHVFTMRLPVLVAVEDALPAMSACTRTSHVLFLTHVLWRVGMGEKHIKRHHTCNPKGSFVV